MAASVPDLYFDLCVFTDRMFVLVFGSIVSFLSPWVKRTCLDSLALHCHPVNSMVNYKYKVLGKKYLRKAVA